MLLEIHLDCFYCCVFQHKSLNSEHFTPSQVFGVSQYIECVFVSSPCERENQRETVKGPASMRMFNMTGCFEVV